MITDPTTQALLRHLADLTPHPLATPTAATVTTAINYPVPVSVEIVVGTAAGITITLPTPVGVLGAVHEVINSSAGSLTLATAAGTINGDASITLYSEESAQVVSDNANWRIR